MVGQLHTTEVSGVDAIRGVVTRDGDSRVDTCCVGVPDIHRHIGDRGTVGDIHVLDLKEQVDTLGPLSLLDVGAEVFANHVVRAGGDLRGQDARRVGIEHGLKGREHVIIVNTSVVVVDCLPFLKGSQITAVLLRVGLDAAGFADSLDSVGSPLDVALLDATGGSRVGTSTKRTSANLSSEIADLDFPLDVIVAVVLAGVGEGTGGQTEAGGDLRETNHLDDFEIEKLKFGNLGIVRKRLCIQQWK